eukprot:9630955-Alexandrium_andersonii.AAC.1
MRHAPTRGREGKRKKWPWRARLAAPAQQARGPHRGTPRSTTPVNTARQKPLGARSAGYRLGPNRRPS